MFAVIAPSPRVAGTGCRCAEASEETRAYVAKRTAEGKTKPDIMRCLKHHITREIWTRTKHLRQQLNTHPTTT
jgi:hypothetical protein